MYLLLRNKTCLRIIISLVLVTNIFVLMRPELAYAQLAVVNPTQDANTVWEKIQKGLVVGGLGALVQGTSYFMRKLAYDGAKYLASSAAGQKPLVFQEGFATYIENAGDVAVGAAIEELGKPFGLDLCKPPDIRTQIMLQVSLSQIYSSAGPAEPDCSWTKFASTWGSEDYWKDNYSGDALSERFATSLSVTQGDFGIALGAMGKIDRNIAEKKEASILERMLGDGYMPVKDAISGKILTPAQTIKEEASALTAKSQAAQSNQQIAGIYAAGAWEIFPTALSIFANTFISSLLSNIMNDGLLPADSKTGVNVLEAFASNVNYNRQAAERAFSYLTAGNPQIDATAYDVITRYSSCPDDPGLDNCVMDNGLVQVLQRSKNGDTMTISEAIEAGLLHGDWKLLSWSREDDNTNFGCYNEGYCYSNVQKLRKAGIFPIGFEVAILKSNPDNPVTLSKVVERFYDCNDPQNPSPDSAHPYCHLIDPNWLLKAPLAQCTTKVNGPELLSENVGQRRQECADFSTCIAYDDTGSCIKYGYCTQEKNTWRIPGETCDEQFNTCQTFTNNTTGDIGSYLTRSVDYGMCNAESVGCRGYSLEQDTEGNWLNSTEINIDDKFDYGQNQLAYFNTVASQYACSEADNGCNLYVDNNTQQKLYLKKAPDYLGCYDIKPDTDQVDWVQTKADFQLLADVPEQCNNFAGACIAEEVGCESYSPQNGGFDVTGIVEPENVCQAECVGYDTFKQGASAFENSRFPLYFIPSQGESCPAQYSGCDAFVDLGDNMGEQIAYFSEVKHCAQPDGDNAKVFYTWEGSESEGYVLKKHTLLKETKNNKEVPAYNGSADPTLTVLCNETSYNALLENPYDPISAPIDCRAYYDDAGDISYRLKEYTVTVSDDCTKYRKVEPYFEIVVGKETCSNGGTLKETNGVKECIYNTIISEAQVCPASANRCRSYIGNTGNNVFDLYSHSFEPNENEPDSLLAAKKGWSSNTSVAPEATQVGLYSLRVGAGDAVYSFDSEVLRNGIQYELSFWARGVPQQLKISLVGDTNVDYYFTKNLETNENIYAPIDTEWREYKLGPIPFEDTTNKGGKLVFSRVGVGGIYFIDNIIFTSVGSNLDDYIHIKKDSWKTPEGYDVPQVCDSTPNDAFPGEHLGCQLYDYTRAPNESIALSGFDKLCRSEAVGCTEVIDTRNTILDTIDNVDATHKLAYNVLCKKGVPPQGQGQAPIPIQNNVCSVDFANETYTCELEKGKTSCYIDGPIDIENATYIGINGKIYDILQYSGATPATGGISEQAQMKINIESGILDVGYMTTSTVIISKDSDPQYLTQFNIATGDDYLCNSQALGCQEVGLEYQGLPSGESAYTYSSSYLRVNDPSLYGQTLCTSEQEGCSQFTSKSQISFFKDPLLSGRPLCNYKEGVELSGVKYSGWFMDGVGQCSEVGTGYCRSDDECPGDTNTCEGIGIQACYQNYLLPGSEYGLWSNGSENYDNFVGTCDITQNGCSELIDPADTANVGGEGQKYYVLDNEKLYQNIDDCKGNKVSQKEGCILFNKTSNPNKSYDSVSTYASSTKDNYNLIDPKRVDPTIGDSNMVLKVIRDRQCSEWLACRSSVKVVDELGKSHKLCQEYQACSELDASGDCTKWVHNKSDNQRLTESKYISRGVSWYDSDYTGYSIFNAFNPSNFVYLLFSGHDDAYLGYEMNASEFFSEPEDKDFGCAEVDSTTKQPKKEDGAICGYEDGGRCYRQRCLYPINGVFTNNDEIEETVSNESDEDKQERIDRNIERVLEGLTQASCKNYPEPNSPFDSKMIKSGEGNTLPKDVDKNNDKYRTEFNTRLRPFERAEVCQVYEDGKGNEVSDCSCEYLKVEYKNGTTDYWPRKASKIIPEGICSGAKTGEPCDDNNGCIDDNKTDDKTDDIRGICNKKQKQGEFIGQKGLCMEYDLSRPLTRDKEGKKMYEQFACLTWLPIQVSASAIDLYNANPEAGYYPVKGYDSEFGGLSYCTKATNYYNGYFDSTVAPELEYLDIHVTKGEPLQSDIYEKLIFYIENNGGPLDGNPVRYGSKENIPKVFQYDEGLKKDIFTGAYFNNDGGQVKYKYPAIQTWAWNNIGSNARILRMDVTNDKGAKPGSHYYNVSDDNIVRNFTTGKTGGVMEFSTFMHPPRLWKNLNNISNNNYNYKIKIGNNTEADASYFSPDIAPDQFGIYTDKNFEPYLQEKDIDEIFFIPIGYPGGVDGPAPVFGKELRLPIAELRVTSTPFYLKTGIGTTEYGNDKFEVYNSSVDTNGYLFVYKLIRDDFDNKSYCKGLKSYCDYKTVNGGSTISSPSGDSDLINSVDSEDNKIYTRYTAVFYVVDNDNFLYHSKPESRDPSLETFDDPFIKSCQTGKKDNWFVIGMDFNKDGKFLGYISKYCNSANVKDGDEDNAIAFAVVATMEDQCLEYATVVDNDISSITGDNNKAWTDRVWNNSMWTNLVGTQAGNDDKDHGYGLAPFGSLPDTFDKKYLANNTLNVKFPDLVLGIPYEWSGTRYPDKDGSVVIGVGDKNNNYYETNYFVDLAKYSAKNSGKNMLYDLFTKVYQWHIVNSSFVSDTINNKATDNSNVFGVLSPPHIYAVNYVACDEGSCSAAEIDSFTLNKRNYSLADYDGDTFSDEDRVKNDAPDPIIAYGSYPAVAQFYAIADDNHMPIRRVMVDWDDGTPVVNEGRYGSYKNRKPYCGEESGQTGRCSLDSNEITSQLTCDKHEDCIYALGKDGICQKDNPVSSFGDASRACKPEFFEFSHLYYCDQKVADKNRMTPSEISSSYIGNPGIENPMFPSQASAMEARDRLIEQGIEDKTEKVCIFKPGIQVLDNWGWCNGVGLDGSYVEGYADGSEDECSSNLKYSFTPYQGVIILIPDKEI